MEQLRKLMELVDKNVGTIPEGDYIEMCNSMKAIHDLVNKPRRLRYEPSIYLGYDTSVPCLLYTSPSPRDLSTSRMPSSA